MAVGRDRPGIVQVISEVLLDHRLNIEDSQMTILGGHFATMLIVSGADGPDEAGLTADLLRAGARVGLEQVSVRVVVEVGVRHTEDAPDRMRIDALEQALAAVGAEQGVDVTIRPLERDEL